MSLHGKKSERVPWVPRNFDQLMEKCNVWIRSWGNGKNAIIHEVVFGFYLFIYAGKGLHSDWVSRRFFLSFPSHNRGGKSMRLKNNLNCVYNYK